MMTKKLISFVFPAYKEQKSIPMMYTHLMQSIIPVISRQYDYELIFVNDGSPDHGKTRAEIVVLCKKDEKVKGINFSRNFGKEIALTAWIEAAKGDAVITLDVDGQHPIEKIPDFLAHREQGYDIVYNKRPEIKGASWFKRVSSKLFYAFFNAISSFQLESQTTDYRLLDRKVVDVFLTFKEKNRMYRGLIDLLGFEKKALVFDALPNQEGREASYNYNKLLKLALDSVTSFSVWPLKLVGIVGLALTLCSFFAILFVIAHLFFFDNIRGFTNLWFFTLINTFFIGMMMMSLGLIAIYIANIHEEVQDRPLYIAREKVNLA
jgi:polyisoprenyl-phosphate glycosyltransferase